MSDIQMDDLTLEDLSMPTFEPINVHFDQAELDALIADLAQGYEVDKAPELANPGIEADLTILDTQEFDTEAADAWLKSFDTTPSFDPDL